MKMHGPGNIKFEKFFLRKVVEKIETQIYFAKTVLENLTDYEIMWKYFYIAEPETP
jgi:hypothetical protein